VGREERHLIPLHGSVSNATAVTWLCILKRVFFRVRGWGPPSNAGLADDSYRKAIGGRSMPIRRIYRFLEIADSVAEAMIANGWAHRMALFAIRFHNWLSVRTHGVARECCGSPT
jgi:hypothetical protein